LSTTRLIAGRYRLERRLGLGGMSTVQLAFDSRLERNVAVKLLAEHLADDPSFVSRFRREALAAARLVHPNVVQVFDFGLDEGSGRHFIVMEHVTGRSCAQILRDEGHLDVSEGVSLLTQACRGLAYAHRNGVVHRDVKPGNLLRSDDGVLKLADFGIAKATEQSSITQAGSVLGTAAYLSPEQARGEQAGPGTDLYSLGVVAYQLLAGRLPYEATSLSELALRQQQELPPPLDEVAPEVPAALAHAVARSMDLDPARRFPDAAALEEGLLDGAEGFESEATAATVASPTTATTRMLDRDETTAATRVGGPRTRQAPAAAPRRAHAPREAPALADSSAQQAAARGSRDPARRRQRVLLGFLIALVVAAAIAIGIAVSTSGNRSVRLQPVNYPQAGRVVQAMQGLVSDNTR
jgi:serine/threonine-protein kinase